MSTSTLMGGITPAQWRALNALFYAGTGGMNTATLRRAQCIEWPHLVGLENAELVTATLGSTTQVKLADMMGPTHAVRVGLTGAGRTRCIRNRANQVICVLGSKASHGARVRDCKGEGMADDHLLFEMGAAGLVTPAESGILLSMFKRLPWNLVLRLTAKGRGYFPLDMVGVPA